MSRVVAALRRSPILAAFLSFLLPGLGQGWLGRMRRGLVFSVPVLVLAGYAAGVYLQQGRARSLGLLLQPTVLLALLVLNVLLVVWRGGAILDAFRLARTALGGAPGTSGGRVGWASGTLLAVLLLATLATHAGLGYLSLKTYSTVTAVFVTPQPSPTPALPDATPGASATPQPTPEPTPEPDWQTDGRLDVLLVGGDAGPGRAGLRTDTMILLSVDVATGRAAMFGFPRNLFNVPLPPGPAAIFPSCECYPDLLNSLFVFALERPQLFRGGASRGYLALQDAISETTGLQLDGMVVVTLQGFVRLIDALGGLDITTPYPLYDAKYPSEDGRGHEPIWIPAGPHNLDGHLALAYARSRHQDNDYNRMERQQLVLTALRRQICPGDLVLRIPELLDIAQDSLWTNLPIEGLPDLLELGNRVRTDRISHFQFWPPDIPEALTPAAVNDIRRIVADPWSPLASPAPSVPGATPTPAEGGC